MENFKFNEFLHEYTLNDKKIPSVTQIIKGKLGFVNSHIERAIENGMETPVNIDDFAFDLEFQKQKYLTQINN